MKILRRYKESESTQVVGVIDFVCFGKKLTFKYAPHNINITDAHVFQSVREWQ